MTKLHPAAGNLRALLDPVNCPRTVKHKANNWYWQNYPKPGDPVTGLNWVLEEVAKRPWLRGSEEEFRAIRDERPVDFYRDLDPTHPADHARLRWSIDYWLRRPAGDGIDPPFPQE